MRRIVPCVCHLGYSLRKFVFNDFRGVSGKAFLALVTSGLPVAGLGLMTPPLPGLRGVARGLRGHGHRCHGPSHASPPRSPQPKAINRYLIFATTSIQKSFSFLTTRSVFKLKFSSPLQSVSQMTIVELCFKLMSLGTDRCFSCFSQPSESVYRSYGARCWCITALGLASMPPRQSPQLFLHQGPPAVFQKPNCTVGSSGPACPET
jgi:hypothetical protein